MNRKEKNEISKNRILSGALKEFGTKSYENSSLNNICNDNNISKGLIYHYFENKDSLYLNCVEECFGALSGFLKEETLTNNDFQEDIKNYLALRHRFFTENPLYSNIFFNTVLQPPQHLIIQIKSLKKDFDMQVINHYKKCLSGIRLRDEITIDEAAEYFTIFQEMFNGYFRDKAYEKGDYNQVIEAHELNISKILNIILYGISKEEVKPWIYGF